MEYEEPNSASLLVFGIPPGLRGRGYARGVAFAAIPALRKAGFDQVAFWADHDGRVVWPRVAAQVGLEMVWDPKHPDEFPRMLRRGADDWLRNGGPSGPAVALLARGAPLPGTMGTLHAWPDTWWQQAARTISGPTQLFRECGPGTQAVRSTEDATVVSLAETILSQDDYHVVVPLP